MSDTELEAQARILARICHAIAAEHVQAAERRLQERIDVMKAQIFDQLATLERTVTAKALAIPPGLVSEDFFREILSMSDEQREHWLTGARDG